MNISRFTTLVIAFALGTSVSFAQSVYGIDGIAGQDTLLKANGLTPNTTITFFIEKPNGTYHILTEYADRDGKTSAILSKEETTQSGVYRVALKTMQGDSYAPFVAFRIYPGKVSQEHSQITVSRVSAQATGKDAIVATVTLRDAFGNVIPDHEILLFGLRPDDTLQTGKNGAITDANGNAMFQISSTQPGITSLSAFDATSATMIQQNIQIAFAPTQIGGFTNDVIPLGQTLFAQVPEPSGGQTGIATSFRIDSEDTITTNQSITLTVQAVNAGGTHVPSYTGTIRFSTTDQNALLPADYTFRPEDLGTHTFSAVVRFATPGIHSISVTDVNDLAKAGEKVFTVTLPRGSVQAQGSAAPEIETPVTGAYATTTQTISGTAPPGTQLKFFDVTEEIGTETADAEGRFSFTKENLTEGEHVFAVAAYNAEGTEIGRSEAVTIEIDKKAPEIQSATLEPNERVQPKTPITLIVESEEGISQAIMTMGVDVRQLNPDADIPGKYTATFVAPQDEGSFPIDIILVDRLGNESTFRGELTLITDKTAAGTPGAVPNAPENIIVTPEENRVSFTWDPVQHQTAIDHYKIYYGLSTQDLTSSVDTFDNRTTWYIPNLTNGIEYYFAIAAVDSIGNEGTRSEVLSAIPMESHEAAPLSETPTGPGLALLGAGTLLAALGYTGLRRRK